MTVRTAPSPPSSLLMTQYSGRQPDNRTLPVTRPSCNLTPGQYPGSIIMIITVTRSVIIFIISSTTCDFVFRCPQYLPLHHYLLHTLHHYQWHFLHNLPFISPYSQILPGFLLAVTSAVVAGQVECGGPGGQPRAQVAGSGVQQWGADTRPVHTSCIYTLSTQYLHSISTQYLLSVSAVDIQRGGDNVSGAAQWGRGSWAGHDVRRLPAHF